MCSLVTSIFLSACELWTLTAELQRKIQAMEMRCYRKILHISYKDPVTNEEVFEWEDNIRKWTGLEFTKCQRAVENREKWRKLVVKSSVVPKRPSRLRDSVRWKSLPNPRGQWRIEKRRKLVVGSSVVP